MARHYTEEEDAIIMEKYPTIGVKVAELLPDRDIKSIALRAKHLGYSKQDHAKGDTWTDEEVELLRKNFTKMGSTIVCLFPNRTLAAIRNKAQMIGIPPHYQYTDSSDPNWSRAEDRIIIKACYSHTENRIRYDDRLLELLPDKDEDSIRRRVANLAKYRNGILGGYPINVYIEITGSYKGYESVNNVFEDLVESALTAIRTNSNKPNVARLITEAFELHYKFGMSTLDISEELNVSEDTAKWLLSNGIKFINQALLKKK